MFCLMLWIFCAFHRCKNIKKFVKGGIGHYSCWWFYNLLLKCKLPTTLTSFRFKHSHEIQDNALCFINSIDDHQQFPAARCALHPDACMFQRHLHHWLSQWTGQIHVSGTRRLLIQLIPWYFYLTWRAKGIMDTATMPGVVLIFWPHMERNCWLVPLIRSIFVTLRLCNSTGGHVVLPHQPYCFYQSVHMPHTNGYRWLWFPLRNLYLQHPKGWWHSMHAHGGYMQEQLDWRTQWE